MSSVPTSTTTSATAQAIVPANGTKHHGLLLAADVRLPLLTARAPRPRTTSRLHARPRIVSAPFGRIGPRAGFCRKGLVRRRSEIVGGARTTKVRDDVTACRDRHAPRHDAIAKMLPKSGQAHDDSRNVGGAPLADPCRELPTAATQEFRREKDDHQHHAPHRGRSTPGRDWPRTAPSSPTSARSWRGFGRQRRSSRSASRSTSSSSSRRAEARR